MPIKPKTTRLSAQATSASSLLKILNEQNQMPVDQSSGKRRSSFSSQRLEEITKSDGKDDGSSCSNQKKRKLI